MAVQTAPATGDRPAGTQPLPLENGDRLSRGEFERRYSARPDLKKAELIEGVVYLPSPVRSTSRSRPHAAILGWLVTYCASTPGVWADDNATVRLDLDNEPQPDALIRIDEEAGGRSRISADDYIEGAPELIVEIAASSAAIDLHDKLRAYRRNGVQEYVVWRVLDREIDWFVLSDGEYHPLNADTAGTIESRVFPDSAWPSMRCCRETLPGCSRSCRTACALPGTPRLSRTCAELNVPGGTVSGSERLLLAASIRSVDS